jgi:hypothetical protein
VTKRKRRRRASLIDTAIHSLSKAVYRCGEERREVHRLRAALTRFATFPWETWHRTMGHGGNFTIGVNMPPDKIYVLSAKDFRAARRALGMKEKHPCR